MCFLIVAAATIRDFTEVGVIIHCANIANTYNSISKSIEKGHHTFIHVFAFENLY